MLTSILKHWREWGLDLAEEPVAVRALENGLTNRNFLLNSAGRKLVLRLNAANSVALGIDRMIEAKILAVTATVGLSPKRYYCDPEKGILVTDFLDAWQPQTLNSVHLKLLAKRLWQVHQLDVDVPAVSYVDYTECYMEQLYRRQGGLTRQQEQWRATELPFVEVFESRAGLPAGIGPRLCHHDPSPSHWRLQDEQLCLIDWEYAALRDPACDLVLLARSWRFSPPQIEQLLYNYGPGVSKQRFAEAQRVCDYVDRLWFAIQGTETAR